MQSKFNTCDVILCKQSTAIDKMFTDKITVICMYTKKQIDKEYVCKDMFSLSQKYFDNKYAKK